MRPIEKYLDEVKHKSGFVTDKALADRLGIKASSLCHIRNGNNTPSEEHCKMLAEIAGDPYEKVLLIAQVSRSPEISRTAWERILRTMAKAGVFTLMAGFLMMTLASTSEATPPTLTPTIVDNGYYVKLQEVQNTCSSRIYDTLRYV